MKTMFLFTGIFQHQLIDLNRKSLLENYNRGEYFVEIDLAHLAIFDNILLDVLQREPNSYLPQVC